MGVLYLANLNLPRSIRFKWENIIVVGIIPGLDKGPESLNEFLMPLVKEMKALWSGAYLKSSLCRVPLRFRAAIASVVISLQLGNCVALRVTTLIVAARSASNCSLEMSQTLLTFQVLREKNGQSETFILTGNMQES